MKKELVDALREEFPDKNIVVLGDPDDPHEVVVEVDGCEDESTAIALVERSEPHFHIRTEERYVVVSGRLHVHVEDQSFTLGPGKVITILPGFVHWAESAEETPARIRVIASPPWTPEDHILNDPR